MSEPRLPEKGEVLNPKLFDIIQCQVDKSEITVGEVIQLTCPLWPNHPEIQTLRFYNSGKNEEFTISILGEPESPSELKLVQKITSYKVGNHQFSELRIKSSPTDLALAPININVKSVVQQQQQPGGQGPTPFPSYGPGFAQSPWWWWAIWGSLVLAIAATIGFKVYKIWLRKKKKAAMGPQVVLQGEALFQSKMRKLESHEYHRRGQFKTFAIELSNLVKEAISETMNFEADDLTTEELIKKIEKQNPLVFRKVGTDLEDLTKTMDLLKFAKSESSTEACLIMLDRAYKIGRAFYGAPK